MTTSKIIWTKEESISGGKVGHYRGVQVEKTKYHYWVHWSEHVDWAAPHSRMSDGLRSPQAAKRMIDHLLNREAHDLTLIVRRHDKTEAKALWAARGYNSPIGAGGRRRSHLTLVKEGA